LAEASLGADANLESVGFKTLVLGLLGVELHRHRAVAYVLDLIDRPRLGERAASGVVFGEIAAHVLAPWRREALTGATDALGPASVIRRRGDRATADKISGGRRRDAIFGVAADGD